MDTLHFMVEVMATGWIGLGFAKEVQPDTSSMVGYDVAVAMVSASGQGTITVKYSTNLHRMVQVRALVWFNVLCSHTNH